MDLMHDGVKYLYKKRLNEKLQEELEGHLRTYTRTQWSVHGVAKEALRKQDKKKSDNLWWTDEVEQLVGEKRTLYLKWLNTKSEEDKRIFIEKRNEVRRTVNAEKNKLQDKKCTRAV